MAIRTYKTDVKIDTTAKTMASTIIKGSSTYTFNLNFVNAPADVIRTLAAQVYEAAEQLSA